MASSNDEDQTGDEDEWIFNGSGDDAAFDSTVGHIEEIIVESDFVNLQNDFLEKYYKCFEDKEENKLEYMDIFKEYTELIESYIEKSLTERMPEFSMKSFLEQLELRREELDGEIFDILLSFTDFLTFKEMFIDYKALGTILPIHTQENKLDQALKRRHFDMKKAGFFII